MQAQLIVMLTHNDVTVKNAAAVFDACKDLPVKFWGFKNVGISREETRALLDAMKKHGKTTCLEVVTFTEESCLDAARMAVEFGFDYFTGTVFYQSVADYLSDKPIRYYPFVGDVSGSPCILEGTMEEIAEDCRRLEAAGAHGVDLIAYRYIDGDPVELAKKVVVASKKEVILAGSISSEERIRIVNNINPFAFTMGSALFEKQFVADGDVRANLQKVIALMNAIPTLQATEEDTHEQ